MTLSTATIAVRSPPDAADEDGGVPLVREDASTQVRVAVSNMCRSHPADQASARRIRACTRRQTRPLFPRPDTPEFRVWRPEPSVSRLETRLSDPRCETLDQL
eukprot:3876794-Rhodomonas_salina.4